MVINNSKPYLFVANLLKNNSELLIIFLKSDNEYDMINEVKENIQHFDDLNLNVVWYKVIDTRNGLVVA
jgi:hypothetical protein